MISMRLRSVPALLGAAALAGCRTLEVALPDLGALLPDFRSLFVELYSLGEFSAWPTPDVDGDGTSDALVFRSVNPDATPVTLTWLSGRSGAPLHTVEFPSSRSAVELLLVPDQDGDGGMDLCIVRAIEGDAGTKIAWIFSGRSGGLIQVAEGAAASDLAASARSPVLREGEPGALSSATGLSTLARSSTVRAEVEPERGTPCWTAIEARLGLETCAVQERHPDAVLVALFGDLDRDGTSDVIVVSPVDTVRIVSGSTGSELHRSRLADPANALLRRECAPLDDVDADGESDLLLVSALVIPGRDGKASVRAGVATWYSLTAGRVLRSLTPAALEAPPYTDCPRIEFPFGPAR